MTIEDRLANTQQRYNTLQAQRNEHVQTANDLLIEMNKIEGEFRLLEELASEEQPIKPNKKATTVEAVAEEK